MIVFGTWFLVHEEKRSVDLPELKLAARSLLAAVRNRSLWIVALFLFLYSFSPGFHTPLYYHMTDTLLFSQGYIGILGAISSAGSICVALIYWRSLAKLTSKRLLQLSIGSAPRPPPRSCCSSTKRPQQCSISAPACRR